MFSSLSDKLQDVFKNLRGHGKITESNVTDAMREVRMALLEADVEYSVAKNFIARVKEKALGESVIRSVTPGQQIVKIFHDELTALLGGDSEPLQISPEPPTRIMLVGLRGSGKTTSCGKLSLLLKKSGKVPVLVPSDLARPAAVMQLHTLAKQVGVQAFQPAEGQRDVLANAREALAWAAPLNPAVVIFDTAGRLEIDEPLVEELRKLKDIVQPHEILLVCDAATGQQAVSVATHFHNALGITGIILTKLDGDARGGAALSMREVTQRPIKFAGVGEKLENFEVFYPERLSSRILGMGDVISLVEKAAEALKDEDMSKMEARMRNATFDLNDFLEQIRMIKKLGPLEGILKMLPGMSQMGDLSMGEKQMKRVEAIIFSMTPGERTKPEILNAKRRRRIAAGSGTTVADINSFLRQYDMMRRLMKDKGMMRKLMGQFGAR